MTKKSPEVHELIHECQVSSNRTFSVKRHQIGHCSQRDAAFQPPRWEFFGTSEELELSKAEGALEAQ